MQHFFQFILCITLLNTLIIKDLNAQQPIEIKVKIQGYNYDTLWLGQSFGKRAVPNIPTTRQPDGSFIFKTEMPAIDGFHAIVYKRAAKAKFQFFPIVLAKSQGNFSLETQLDKFYEKPQIIDNQETTILFEYLKSIEPLFKTRDSMAFQWRDLGTSEAFELWMLAEDAVRKFQENFIEKHPETWASRLAKQTFEPRPPAQSPAATDPQQHWQFMFEQYFSSQNWSDPHLFRSPAFIEFLDYFVFKLPLPEPQHIQNACEKVFKLLETNPDWLKYYFNYVVNSFGSISKYQGDEVFYFLVKNYVEQGKAPWTTNEEAQKMSNEAQRMEKLFVGKTPAPVTLYQQDGTPVALNSVAARRTFLVFWNPDCGHCKKELPILKKITPEFEAQGMKVIAICGKKLDENKQCWDYLSGNPLPPSWLILHDPEGKSRMNVTYNLRTFPRLFLLDEQKKILWKRAGEVPEVELLRVFDKFLKG